MAKKIIMLDYDTKDKRIIFAVGSAPQGTTGYVLVKHVVSEIDVLENYVYITYETGIKQEFEVEKNTDLTIYRGDDNNLFTFQQEQLKPEEI